MNHNHNSEQTFFTAGVGDQPETVNNFMPENNLDLSSNRTWNTTSRGPEKPGAIFSAERMPEVGDAAIEAGMPPMVEPTLEPQDSQKSTTVQYDLSMSGDKISHVTMSKVANMVDEFRRGSESPAAFYDQVRDAASSFRANSFGVKR